MVVGYLGPNTHNEHSLAHTTFSYLSDPKYNLTPLCMCACYPQIKALSLEPSMSVYCPSKSSLLLWLCIVRRNVPHCYLCNIPWHIDRRNLHHWVTLELPAFSESWTLGNVPLVSLPLYFSCGEWKQKVGHNNTHHVVASHLVWLFCLW